MALEVKNAILWFVNCSMSVIALVPLIDAFGFGVLLIVGIVAAVVFYYSTGGWLVDLVRWPTLKTAFVDYSFIVFIKLVFARYQENILRRRVLDFQIIGDGISHELKDPLATISHLSGNLKQYLKRCIPHKQEAAQGLTKSETQILREIPSHFDIFSKRALRLIKMFTSGEISAHYTDKIERFSVADCIEKALSEHRITYGESETIEWTKANDFNLYGDKDLLICIFSNLLRNSAHAIRKSGKGSISIWIGQTKFKNTIHLKDTAIGISPDILPNIFNPYVSSKRDGTGIGLALCSMATKALGGTIGCKTRSGEFAEFQLAFRKHLSEEV